MPKVIYPNKKMKTASIKEHLRQQIALGKLLPNSLVGGAKDLARTWGVSPFTANLALAELTAEGLLKRIQGKGTFVAEHLGKSKALGYRIGLCFPGPSNSGSNASLFAAFEVFPHAARAFIKHQGHSTVNVPFEDLQHSDFDKDLKLDALLISCVDDRIIANLLKRPYPVAMVLQTQDSFYPLHQVIPDINQGFYRAALLFKAKGFSKINLVFSDIPTHRDRAEVFRRSARWAGYENDNIIFNCNPHLAGDLGQLSGNQLASKLLEQPDQEHVYFSVSDFFSFGFLSAFLDKGLKPNEDFYLISFDNLEGENLLPFGEPVLTSVSFSKRQIVEEAIKLLAAEIETPSTGTIVRRVPEDVVIRKTFF
jgi:DNA-binding LacI/PurR family transcriptional regulator